MKISIMLEAMPAPGRTAQSPVSPKPIPVEDRVRDALELINSGHESHKEWLLINKLYKQLRGKSSPRAQNLCKMIKPVLAKFGYFDTTAED